MDSILKLLTESWLARGDLGVEVPAEEVPINPKRNHC